ncbi:hypothetical protein MhomT_14020 [Microbacterium hominis]|nr:hypothetical protein MhomT_14020 [Microbacterium hominis]
MAAVSANVGAGSSSSVPDAAAISSRESGLVRRARTTWVSGSPKRALNSMTLMPSAVRMSPAYSSPMNGVPSASRVRMTGSATVRVTSATKASSPPKPSASHGRGE